MSIAWDYFIQHDPEKLAQLLHCRPALRDDYERHRKGGDQCQRQKEDADLGRSEDSISVGNIPLPPATDYPMS